MALSEIEKLERRYAENPQGLTFAPLAEVHRKNGEVQRALDLLGPGLEIHPNYIPASIVLGRCHLDLGNVQGAAAAFLHVLALDGENVIALRALADISERLFKFDEAERWLNTLLSVDRSNDDAREQLQRVEVSRRQAEVASSAEPSTLVEAPAATEMVEVPTVPAEPEVSAPPPPFEPPVAEPTQGWVSQSGSQASGPSPIDPAEYAEPAALREEFEPAGLQVEEPAALQVEEQVFLEAEILPEEQVLLEDMVEPIPGLVGREVETPAEGQSDFRVEMSEDIILQSSGGSEFQMPDAAQELFAGPRPDRPSYAPSQPFEEDAPLGSSAAAEPPAPEPKQDAEPVAVIEVAEAAAVNAAPAAEAAPEERPSPAQPRRSYSVVETGGRSVVQFFQGILSARPPAQASAAPVRPAPATGNAGAPTRPAADALSLSSVFGEEASDTPPAVPSSNPGSGSVSFDDFFSSQGGTPASRTQRAPDPKNDDLDEFHTWLQNLKR